MNTSKPPPADIPQLSLAGGPLLPTAELPLPEIEGYEIVRPLGEGGMGAVYEAWQTQPRRRVAIKFLRTGLLSTDLMRRFSLEIDVLGRLEHPAIARIYAAGSFTLGTLVQPFFTMEFIDGLPITRYVRDRNLSLRERVKLLERMVAGVQYAHQRGVIHRDLKPANILVDREGQPRILDFGVARMQDEDLQLTTTPQDAGKLIGTLAYMSPEQAAGNAAGVDVRTDVYSLGLIAYEVLSDRHPYPLDKQTISTAVRTIHECEPQRLGQVRHACKGDLEIIVAKAIEKDKERRYASAAALASDLKRFLNHEPIEARPPSVWYQTGMFTRRHKALVAAAASISVAVAAGLALASIGLVRARRAEAEAVTQRSRAQANLKKALATVNQFTTFVANGPLANVPEAGPVREQLLRDAAAFYEQFAEGNPEDAQLQVDLLKSLYDLAYERQSSGAQAEARQFLEKRIHLLENLLVKQPQNLELRWMLAQSWADLGVLWKRLGDPEASLSALEKALPIYRRLADENPTNIAILLGFAKLQGRVGRALLDTQNPATAEQALKESLEIYKRLLLIAPADHRIRVGMAYVESYWIFLPEAADSSRHVQASLALWRDLTREDPGHPAYREALEWLEQQIAQPTLAPLPAVETRDPDSPAFQVRARAEAHPDLAVNDGQAPRLNALDINALRQAVGQRALVQGYVRFVEPNVGKQLVTFIQFGTTKGQLIGVIHRNSLPAFEAVYGEGLQDLPGAQVELDGILSSYHDVIEMVLTRPEQIVLLNNPRKSLTPDAVANLPVISALAPDELRAHAEQNVIVEGQVRTAVTPPAGPFTYINFDRQGLDGLTALIREDRKTMIADALGGIPAAFLPGKTVRIIGQVFLHEGLPNIEIRDPFQITIISPDPINPP